MEEIVGLPVTRTNNARKLYSAILSCVKHHPHRYTNFIAVLHENNVLYGDLLKTLEDTYDKKGLSFISHSLVSWSDVLAQIFYLLPNIYIVLLSLHILTGSTAKEQSSFSLTHPLTPPVAMPHGDSTSTPNGECFGLWRTVLYRRLGIVGARAHWEKSRELYACVRRCAY